MSNMIRPDVKHLNVLFYVESAIIQDISPRALQIMTISSLQWCGSFPSIFIVQSASPSLGL